MKKIKITLYTVKEITDFCENAQKIKGNVTIYKDKYVVDAKSLMGLFSIDLSTGVEVEYPDTDKYAIEFGKFCELYTTNE